MKTSKTKQFAAKLLESILVIGYILFEELIWNIFAKPIYQYFKSLVAFDSLKKFFLAINRYLLLTIFLVILSITEALGFFAGYCFLNGYIFSGIMVYSLKIPVAAFTFWLFDLTEDKLMTFPWLKTTYHYVLGLIDQFVHSAIHIYIKDKIVQIRTKIKLLVQQYFGEAGFIASVKSHYAVFKPYISKVIK